MATPGKRAAQRPTSRRTARATVGEPLAPAPRETSPQARRGLVATSSGTSRGFLGPAAGITVAIIGWGSLVYAAIDFGARGRAGDTGAWLLLALASLGAVICLFAALLLAARLFQRMRGSTGTTAPGAPPAAKRAASARAATSGTEPTARLDLPADGLRATPRRPLSDPLSDPLWADLPEPSSQAPADQDVAPRPTRPRHAGGHRAG